MGSIAEKLQYLNSTKNTIKEAINYDNDLIDDTTTFREYAGKIYSLIDMYKNCIPTRSYQSNDITITDALPLRTKTSKIVNNLQQKHEILPSFYRQVDYIENTNNQYIDTGIVPKSTTKLFLDFQMTELKGDSYLFGWSSRGYQESFNFSIADVLRWKYSLSKTSTSFILNKNADLNRHTIEFSSNGSKLDGELFAETSIGDTATDGQTMYLFSEHTEWTAGPLNYSKMRIFKSKIYDGNELVRDFIPCRRVTDNQAGLYDLITKRFFYSPNNANFAYSGDARIPNVEYPQPIAAANIITLNVNEHTFDLELKDGFIANNDEYDLKTGILLKKVEKNILNGTEEWFEENIVDGKSKFKTYIQDIKQDKNSVICATHFSTTNDIDHNEGICGSANENCLYIRSDSFKTIQDVKNYLASHPTEFYYYIKQPYEITVEPFDFKLKENVNFISVDSDGNAEIKIDYFKKY